MTPARDRLVRLGVAVGAGAVVLAASILTANACDLDNSGRTFCRETSAPSGYARASRRQASDAHGNTVIVGRRPAGCPHRYCGCEASLYLFGKIKPKLNLAANWIRLFPRTAPAPKMAAARSGHVMVLISHVSGNDWLVHDGNSGGGLTRRHVRSIRGYVVVNPHATLSAVLQ